MQLWTPEHIRTVIPATIGMIIVAIVLRLTIGKKSERIRFIPFQILAILLVALEIMKQVSQLITGYSLYSLPFHFCSLFIFLHSFIYVFR